MALREEVENLPLRCTKGRRGANEIMTKLAQLLRCNNAECCNAAMQNVKCNHNNHKGNELESGTDTLSAGKKGPRRSEAKLILTTRIGIQSALA